MKREIDAANKILGRLASETAVILRGKDTPHFDSARAGKTKITVFNTDKIRLSGKKTEQKVYRRHSGHIGRLKEEKLRDLLKRDSRAVFKRAVAGMLPKNRLRKIMLKNLILFKGEPAAKN